MGERPITQAFLAVLEAPSGGTGNLKLATLPVTQSLPELIAAQGSGGSCDTQAVATLRGLEVLCRVMPLASRSRTMLIKTSFHRPEMRLPAAAQVDHGRQLPAASYRRNP